MRGAVQPREPHGADLLHRPHRGGAAAITRRPVHPLPERIRWTGSSQASHHCEVTAASRSGGTVGRGCTSGRARMRPQGPRRGSGRASRRPADACVRRVRGAGPRPRSQMPEELSNFIFFTPATPRRCRQVPHPLRPRGASRGRATGRGLRPWPLRDRLRSCRPRCRRPGPGLQRAVGHRAGRRDPHRPRQGFAQALPRDRAQRAGRYCPEGSAFELPPPAPGLGDEEILRVRRSTGRIRVP